MAIGGWRLGRGRYARLGPVIRDPPPGLSPSMISGYRRLPQSRVVARPILRGSPPRVLAGDVGGVRMALVFGHHRSTEGVHFVYAGELKGVFGVSERRFALEGYAKAATRGIIEVRRERS